MSRIVEWLTSLENGKRTVALLLFGIITIFSMWAKSDYNRWIEKARHEKQESEYKEILIQRTDRFNETYRQLLIDCNTRMIDELRKQLDRSESTLIKTNKIVEQNGKLIKKTKITQ